ncbi:MAG: SIS domain-containing protein [Alphaproteobacteria bacterium]|jgi:glucosamine--fructose-6-phosphate aminotransferase (isomerizing)
MADNRSAMAQEIADVPACAERLLADANTLAAIAKWIAAYAPRLVVLCGRGSSGHVGVYLRYLFETKLGLLTSAAAPSVFSAYGAKPDMRGVLFIVISQSGRSPDLVLATKVAREHGALALAIVNDPHSPAAAAADLVLPIHAGVEHAVAATKTVVLSMVAGAQLVAELARDEELSAALQRLPSRFREALGCDWENWRAALVTAPAAFTAGRGYSFGPAREIALKLTETLRIPALGFSTAELRHGPRAAVTPSTPVLIFRQDDQTAASSDALARDLTEAGERVFCAGGPQCTLPWIGNDHPVCDAIAMLLPAYRAIETAARARGLDPDNPPHLSKVTRTL